MDTDLYRSASLRNIEAIHAGEPLMARAGTARRSGVWGVMKWSPPTSFLGSGIATNPVVRAGFAQTRGSAPDRTRTSAFGVLPANDADRVVGRFEISPTAPTP